MDILRLIVIVVIFSGIIVVLLYLKSAKSGRKTKRKYMQATNPYDSSSKEEMHSADAVDDFFEQRRRNKSK
jgi:FtsZ-interacting cell division protein ZipA